LNERLRGAGPRRWRRKGTQAGASNERTQAPVDRKSTTHTRLGPTTDPRELDRREFVERLKTAKRQHAFRVLEVDAVHAEVAARALAARALGKVLDVAPVSPHPSRTFAFLPPSDESSMSLHVHAKAFRQVASCHPRLQ
jgi:hypothetical protein